MTYFVISVLTLNIILWIILKNNVEKLRKELGLNQEDFAKQLRVSRQTISSIETGKYSPSLDLAFAIADYFGKTIEEIFEYEGGSNKWIKRN